MMSISCDICGKDYKPLEMDAHVARLHLCPECFKNLLREYEKELKQND
jgi:ribosome-binding protein aMBF1 (putative translation factor)